LLLSFCSPVEVRRLDPNRVGRARSTIELRVELVDDQPHGHSTTRVYLVAIVDDGVHHCAEPLAQTHIRHVFTHLDALALGEAHMQRCSARSTLRWCRGASAYDGHRLVSGAESGLAARVIAMTNRGQSGSSQTIIGGGQGVGSCGVRWKKLSTALPMASSSSNPPIVGSRTGLTGSPQHKIRLHDVPFPHAPEVVEGLRDRDVAEVHPAGARRVQFAVSLGDHEVVGVSHGTHRPRQ
jgi:hypothetical protein